MVGPALASPALLVLSWKVGQVALEDERHWFALLVHRLHKHMQAISVVLYTSIMRQPQR